MLHPDEWLEQAKAVPLGQSRRVRHGIEPRPNLVVYNSDDSWSCWCFACHDWGKVRKTHVVLRDRPPEMKSGTGLPHDRVPLADAPPRILDRVVRYLIPRGLDYELHIRPLGPMYTAKWDRLLLPQDGGALVGRALGDQPAKCIVYSAGPTPVLALHPDDAITEGCHVVLFEDYLSAIKARAALGPEHVCVSIQGTAIPRSAKPRLMQAARATLMLDGDRAGYEANPQVAASLALLGVKVHTVQTPEGFDPKHLTMQSIRTLVAAAGGTE